MPTSKLSHNPDDPDEAVELIEEVLAIEPEQEAVIEAKIKEEAEAAKKAKNADKESKSSSDDSSAATKARAKAAKKAGKEAAKAGKKAGKKASKAAVAKSIRPANLNPVWLVPTMLTLLIVGLVWIILFYVTSSIGGWPIPALGQWNIAVGFGLILGGGILSTRFK